MRLADEIFAVSDRDSKTVKAWGKKLLIVPMSGEHRDAYDQMRADAHKAGTLMVNWRARYLSYCICDLDGNRVFDKPEDIDALGKKNGETIKRLFDIAQDLNGTGDGAVEEEIKNS